MAQIVGGESSLSNYEREWKRSVGKNPLVGFSPPRSQGELETHDFKKLLDPNTIGELGPTVALSVSYLEFERTEKNMNGFALGITFFGKELSSQNWTRVYNPKTSLWFVNHSPFGHFEFFSSKEKKPDFPAFLSVLKRFFVSPFWNWKIGPEQNGGKERGTIIRHCHDRKLWKLAIFMLPHSYNFSLDHLASHFLCIHSLHLSLFLLSLPCSVFARRILRFLAAIILLHCACWPSVFCATLDNKRRLQAMQN